MRLICPNCEAHYEVPEDMIPEDGRHVQCSNCETVWFFKPPEPAGKRPDLFSDNAFAARVSAPMAGTAPDAPQTRGAAPSAEAPDPQDGGPREAPSFRRRQIDPEVLAVLREEADFEARARAAEAGEQTFAGAPAGTRAETPSPRSADADAPTAPDELPDAEQINATWRMEDFGQAGESAETTAPRRARSGAWLAVSFAGLGFVLYACAPQIAVEAPGLAEPIADYVTAVDAGRAWLDDLVLKALAWANETFAAG